ncbi:MAG: cadherin-like beta sandwich domain-containing protein [Nitrospira sp.]|nr:MAG: cadherin-like beta sandwich domain-containing protein [Nitrospira sp.]
MRHYSFHRNIVWIALFSILLVVTLNACSDSNNVTGPPPPIPLSPDAKLSSLTINTGPLDPAFSSDVANYTEDVATSVLNVTVTARPQNANASMTINGQATNSGQGRTILLGVAGSSTPIPIVVTAVNGSQNTYIVTVRRAPPGGNNNLQSLSVSPGPLAPPFAASTTSYTVNVANTVPNVTVTARAQDPGATVSINGQPTTSQSVALGAPGSSTPIPIVVTAPNGTQKTYLVTVSRTALGGNNNLQNLTVTPGPLVPAFAASTTSYTVNVANTVPSVTVTAQAQDTGATVSINGQPTTSQSVALGAPGSSTPIAIEVTAPNGNQKTYTVLVNREALGGNNNLQSLTVTPGTLTPQFSANQRRYTVNVDSTVPSVVVTAQPQDAGATVNINDQTTTSLSVLLGLAGGPNTSIDIDVMAPNGSQRTYTVVVSRAAFIPSGNNNLSALAVSAGALNEPFDAGTLNYTVTALASTTADTTVTATVADSTATLTINGSLTASGVPSVSIPLAPGATTSIPIVVTAENGTPKTYTVNITAP